MPVALFLVMFWVLLASATALTPFPWHRRIAIFLLTVSFAILVAVAVEYGVVYAMLFFSAVVSICRRPPIYNLKRLRERGRREG